MFKDLLKFRERSDQQNFRSGATWTFLCNLDMILKPLQGALFIQWPVKDGARNIQLEKVEKSEEIKEILGNLNFSGCCKADTDLHPL